MTIDQLDLVLRKLCMRRPFQPFTVEFMSGFREPVKHPEAIRKFGGIYVLRAVSGEFSMFAADSVVRLIDVVIPTEST